MSEAVHQTGLLGEIPVIGGALEEGLTFGNSKRLNKITKTTRQATKTVEHAPAEAKKAVEEALSGGKTFALKVAINSLLMLAGLALIVYGVMVAVRPRESAFSIPIPAPVPV
jgi:hypothetical protein